MRGERRAVTLPASMGLLWDITIPDAFIEKEVWGEDILATGTHDGKTARLFLGCDKPGYQGTR